MKFKFPIALITALGMLFSCGYPAGKTQTQPPGPADFDSAFLNPEILVVSKNTVVRPLPADLDWGRRGLENLKVENLGPFEKAARIRAFVSENFKYRIRAPKTIQGIREIKGGNCLSHTILGLFLLRLAGVPAKVSHELQLWNPFFVDQIRARSQKAGYFGSGYNSHYWVLFFDGKEWQPYDSALGITGFDEFFRIRTETKRWPYLLSLNPKRMTGPPFVVEIQSDSLAAGMINITGEIWTRDSVWTNKKVTRAEWMEFVRKFAGKGFGDFIAVPDSATLKTIRKMARKWF